MKLGKSKIFWTSVLVVYLLLPFGNQIADVFHSLSFTISKYKTQHYILPIAKQNTLKSFAMSTGRHNIDIENNAEHDHEFLKLFKGFFDDTNDASPEKNSKSSSITFEKHILPELSIKTLENTLSVNQKTKNFHRPESTSGAYYLRDTPPPQA